MAVVLFGNPIATRDIILINKGEKTMHAHERTELELHVIDHFSKQAEQSDWQELDPNEHCLQEFYHGYSENKSAYASTPEEIELIDDCIRILAADIEGSLDYNANDCATVIKALETFGL
jgi:saccharopine dehydrogenase-like NADP-dependent oxidoreductase